MPTPIPEITLTTRLQQEQERHLDRVIGGRLSKFRTALSLSREDLAALSGIPEDELAEHESGEIPIPMSRVRPIAAVLDLHPLELFIRLVLPGC